MPLARPLALIGALAVAAAAAAGEPARIGDLREELLAITTALEAERSLATRLSELDRPGIQKTGARIAVLEQMRAEALLRLARRAEQPRWPRPAPGVPPAAFATLLADPAWAAADPPVDEAGLREAIHVPTGLLFVLVPGGRFTMGWEEHVDEKKRPGIPPRTVEVAPFLLCKTECAQEAWVRGGRTVPIEAPPGPSLPITGFSWVSYRGWCLENGLRLPTEEEWEYACRAGTRTLWPHGDEEAELDAYAWFSGNSDGRLRPVATLLPNDWGLFDMTGNASEFVGRMTDKVGLVYRGGGYGTTARGCRAAYRYIGYRGGYVVRDSPAIGFRPAASLPEPEADPDR